MVYGLGYRRPAFVSLSSGSTLNAGNVVSSSPERSRSRSRSQSTTRDASILSGSTGPVQNGIPDALSYDRVINGGTAPPITIRDFMNYLLYVERAAENLQFFLWFRYYSSRFSNLPSSEKALSQPWTPEKDAMFSPRFQRAPQRPPAVAIPNIFKGTDFDNKPGHGDKYSENFGYSEKKPSYGGNYGEKFGYSDKMPYEDQSVPPRFDDDASTLNTSLQHDIKKSVAMAFDSADVAFRPFTIQPFREEITRIIATYIADGSPRQLNLGDRERNELLVALSKTTHPSAFRDVIRTVEWSLRHQAHPNFIRWTICNCNPARLRFGIFLGIFTTFLGLACVITLTLSSVNRYWRIMSFIPLIAGFAMMWCTAQGVCPVLYSVHHRHLRPWELFVDADDYVESSSDLKNRSMDSFGTANSWEDEPWLARYEKRNIIRKVFDREIWIEDPVLRRIQDTIFVQASIVGLIGAAILTAAFVAIPQVNKF